MLDFDKMPRFKSRASDIFRMIPQWAFAFEVPEPEIIRQLGEAHAWIECNPKKAPKKNVMRFLNSWMHAAKRYGNLRVNRQVPVVRTADPEPDMSVEDLLAIRRKNFGELRH